MKTRDLKAGFLPALLLPKLVDGGSAGATIRYRNIVRSALGIRHRRGFGPGDYAVVSFERRTQFHQAVLRRIFAKQCRRSVHRVAFRTQLLLHDTCSGHHAPRALCDDNLAS